MYFLLPSNVIVVPGVVSNLMTDVRKTFLVVMWDPPQQSNGVIITYEVTFANNTSITTVNTTKLNAIFVYTSFSNISVRGYTSAGPGSAALIFNEVSTTSEAVVVVAASTLAAAGRVTEQVPYISGVIAFTIVAVIISVLLIVLMLRYLKRYGQFIVARHVEQGEDTLTGKGHISKPFPLQ